MSKKTWIVKGKVLLSGLPDTVIISKSAQPLAGVTVKIYANEGVRWNSWGTTVTKADGSFCLKKSKDKTRRKFKIKVQFKNKDIVIYGENKSLMSTALKMFPLHNVGKEVTAAAAEAILQHVSKLAYKANWYEVYKGTNRSDFNDTYTLNRTININELTAKKFKNGLANRHGAIWYVTHKMVAHLKKQKLPFAKKIAIKYPHNNMLIPNKDELAYASPVNYCAYLIKNSKRDDMSSNKIDTLMHELMHLWVYRYSIGEFRMAKQLAWNGSTHNGIEKKEFVAFHEAFAEFTSRMIAQDMFGKIHSPYYDAPFKKVYLDNLGIDSINLIDNHEIGWLHIFHCLISGELGIYDFNDGNERASIISPKPKDYKSPKLTVYEIMKLIFTPDEIKAKEINLDFILNRVKLMKPEIFSDDAIKKIKVVFNIKSKKNYNAKTATKIIRRPKTLKSKVLN